MKITRWNKKAMALIAATIVSSQAFAVVDVDAWHIQASGTTGNVAADKTGWTFDGTTGIEYDYGALDALDGKPVDGSTVEYILNFNDASSSTAMGRLSSWSPGGEKVVLKIEQYSNTGKFGITSPGYFDKTMDTPSTFKQEVHVVWRRNNDSGTMDLFINGVKAETEASKTNWRLDGGVGTLGCGNSLTSDVATGTIYGVASYDVALTDQQIEDLYDALHVPVISLNMTNGDDANSLTTDASTTAGVAVAGYWENATIDSSTKVIGAKGDTTLTALRDNIGTSTNVGLTFATSGGVEQISGTVGASYDESLKTSSSDKMMQSCVGHDHSPGVYTFSNLSSFASEYDVYVYTDHVNTDAKSSIFVNGIRFYCTSSNGMNGPFAQSSYTTGVDADGDKTRNYVKFSGVTLDTLEVEVKREWHFGVVNGIQIVQTQEPSNPVPATPSATDATDVTGSGFTANWNATSNTTGYKLYVDGVETVINDGDGSTTSYVVATTVNYADPIEYYVVAFNGNGDSASSNTVAVLRDAPAVAGDAVRSEADGEIITTDTSIAAITEATIMCWFKPDASTNTIFALRDGTGSKASLHWSDSGANAVYFTDGGANQWDNKVLTEQIQQDKWSHIAFVLADSPGRTTDGVAKLYVNGTLSATWDYGLNSSSASANFSIGGNGKNGDLGAATYDEVTLWNIQLTEAEIQNYLHTKPAIDASGLLLYWNFDSSDLTDSTANGLDGVASGTSSFGVSGAMIDTSGSFVDSAYVWSGSVTGVAVRGLALSATTSIDYDNTGVLYGITAADDVSGVTTNDLPATGFTSRLNREWEFNTIYVTATGSVSFDMATVGASEGEYQLLKRNAPVRGGSGQFTPVGTSTTVTAGDDTITFTGISLEDGFYTLGAVTNTLTPAIGINVVREGNVLSWTVGEEAGVSHYLIVAEGYDDIVVEADGSDVYFEDVPEGVTVKLVVVDDSGLTKGYLPSNGNIVNAVYTLCEGWNMIAMPGENADISGLNQVVSGGMWGWNGSSYELVKAPVVGEAVWVYAPEAVEIVISADKVEAGLTLTSGWNMVGPTETIQVPAEAHTVYGWNDTYQIVANDGYLMEGVGYWIFRDK